MKRIVAVLLAVLMCTILVLPATEARAVTSGECGPNATWELDDEGTLTISGEGAIIFEDGRWIESVASIERIVIEEGITSIGSMVFANLYSYTNLMDISIPDSITNISSEAFSYGALGGDENAIFNEYKNGKYLGNEQHPYLVFMGAFQEGSEIEIHPQTKMVIARALYGLSTIDSIVVPKSVTIIGEEAFAGACTEGIWVDQANPTYSSDEHGVLFNKDKTELIQAPMGLSSSYIIPDGVKKIGCRAFYRCRELTGVTIPNSVEYIEDSAFAGCHGLTEIVIPDSVKRIGSYAFSDPYTNNGCQSLTSVTIGSGVKSIGVAAFFGIKNLANVTLGDGIQYIGFAAFTENPFTGVNQDILNVYEGGGYLGNERNPYVALVSGVSDDYAMDSLHPNTKCIADDMLGEEYTVYENAKYCGKGDNPYAILVDTVSEEITQCKIHPDTEIIGREAFAYCKGLTEIVIPEGVVGIGVDAFLLCQNLHTVTLPSSLEFIEFCAFGGNLRLREVIYEGSPKGWEKVSVESANRELTDAGVTCTREEEPADKEGTSVPDSTMWIWIGGGVALCTVAAIAVIAAIKKKKK